MLLSSHQLNEVQQVCDRVAIMSRGQVIAAGTVADCWPAARPATCGSGCPTRRRPGGCSSRPVTRSARSDDAWRVSGVADPGQLTRLLSQAGLFLTELTPITADLESVFLDLTETDQPVDGHRDRPADRPSVATDPVGGDWPGGAPTFGRLLGAEFRRLAYRRFVRVLALLAVLGFAAAVVAIYARHAEDQPGRPGRRVPGPGRPDRRDPAVDPGMHQDRCRPAPTRSSAASRRPPRTSRWTGSCTGGRCEPAQISDYALAIGVAVAMLGFAIGASFIGAEWSSKNLICWLYWEPRRLRLLAAKLLALLSVMLAVACLAQLAWFGIAHLLLHYRGLPVSSLGPKSRYFWRHVLDGQLRAILLVLPTTVLGFAIANLIRHTAAAFGVGFVYFAVVESLIRILEPGLAAVPADHQHRRLDQQRRADRLWPAGLRPAGQRLHPAGDPPVQRCTARSCWRSTRR